MIVHLLAGSVVVAFSLFLVGLTVLVFARAALAERFFMSFAGSARAHCVEQGLRLLVGSALIMFSAAMWQALVFRFIGWSIVVSSLGLLLAPWQWHQRFANRVLPLLVRHMKLYGLGSLAFGAFLLYGVFAGASGFR